MNIKIVGQLLFLAAVWGSSFLFMRIGSPEFGAIPLIFMRVFVASLSLVPFIFFVRQRKLLLTEWKMFIPFGLVSTAIPFTLFGYSSLHLTAGFNSVLNAMTPVFGTIVAYVWLKEKLSPLGICGLLMGFLGVFVLSYGGDANGSEQLNLVAVFAALLAPLCYALASCYSKFKLKEMTPLVATIGTQFYSALVMLPFAIWYWPEETPSAQAWYSAIALGVFCTALAVVIYLQMIKDVGVTKTISVTYLVPIFGVFWGHLLLDESITTQIIVGGSLILTGVSATTGVLDNWLLRRRKQVA